MTLVWILLAALVVSLLVGKLAELSAGELAGQTLGMFGAAFLFYGLVALLG